MAEVTITFTYCTDNVIPPRCRKPRLVQERSSVVITVPEVTTDEAPVAFRVQPYSSLSSLEEYRWWGGKTWVPHLPWSHQTEPTLPGSDHFPAEQSDRAYGTDGLAEAEAWITERWSHRYLIIDGVVWIETGEPRYVVMTFGLGHNHGGTALMTSAGYNSNIGKERYFRADEYDEARAEAIRVALARSDTDSVARITVEPPIEVLIPEAVRCQPHEEHGDGDPFINLLNNITADAGSALEAGVLAIAATFKAAS